MRAEIRSAKRIVVKIGSSSLTRPDGRLNEDRLHQLSSQLAVLHASGTRVVLVTSGAIAAGLQPLGLHKRPKDLETQQAAAAVGQGMLIRHYSDAFALHGITIAQLLLTVEDVLRPTTYRNALNTFSRLFRLGVIPVVNENDTVATHEIRFGDNDRLAALVAHLVRADVLVLFSDVPGLFTAHPESPEAEFISRVSDIHSLHVDTSRLGSKIGTGGMRTKLQAAEIATSAGVNVVLAHADDLSKVLAGVEVGTFFVASGKRRPRRLLWLAHAAEMRGRIHVDAGAVSALQTGRASLLLVGVSEVEGAFEQGDPVEISGPDGKTIAKGLASYGSHELLERMRDISQSAPTLQSPVVRRDLLILT